MWRVCTGFLTCSFLLVLAGRDAVACPVNSLDVTHSAWSNVVLDTGVRFFEIERICSDTSMHRSTGEALKVRHPRPQTADVEEHA
jgi:hypothetical protein